MAAPVGFSPARKMESLGTVSLGKGEVGPVAVLEKKSGGW